MNYSEPYFCKLFKQYFDQNFTAYLTEYRIAEAKKLLEQPTFNIKDVGKAVGYSDSITLQRYLRGSPDRVRRSIGMGDKEKYKENIKKVKIILRFAKIYHVHCALFLI